MAKNDDQAGRQIGREMSWGGVREHAEWHGFFPASRTRSGGSGFPPAANCPSQPSFRIGEFIPWSTGMLLMFVRDSLNCSTVDSELFTLDRQVLYFNYCEANCHVLCVRKERSHCASAYYIKIIHYYRK
jgi:hypothetical protein